MKYIVSGPALDKVLRENRIRIARGEIKFTPFVEAAPATVKDVPEDTKDVPETPAEDVKDVPETPAEDVKDVPEDTKDVPVVDEKKPVKKAKK